jgi:aminodeoxyfutalosine synthase
MRTNVTMLYGHIETAEERVDHMLRARALQDETGGFQAFIPLAFHPDNNQMRKLPAPSAADSLRVHAVARLMCDNIAHVKAFWIATGVEVAQTALWFGVDDLDGTVQEEKIYHMAGARTPEAMSTREIERLIHAAGRDAVERDTLYNVIEHQRAG